MKTKNINLIVIFVLVIIALVWQIFLLRKYVNFGYYDWDLALYAQAMWRMMHGSLETSLFGMNFLGNHAEYISFLVLPLYFFFPHPLTLVYLNIGAFIISAYILYLVFQKYLSPWLSAILCLLYVFYPPNLYMLAYEFHFESLALPFIAGMFLYYIEHRFIPFMIFGLLACLCKENIPSIMVMFGLFSLFRRGINRCQWGVIPIVTGFLYFCCVMFIIIPFIRHELPTTGNIYVSMFQPKLLLSFSALNIEYLKELFTPLVFIPFIGGWPLLLSTPIFAQNMLSSMFTMHTIYFHYAATIAPFIFVATAIGLHLLKKILRPSFFVFIIVLMVFASSLVFTQHSKALNDKLYQVRYPKNDIENKMILAIPTEASVVASFKYLSHLSNRNEVYAFYNVWLGRNLFTGNSFVLPKTVRYAMVDLEDPWLRDGYRVDPVGVQRRVQAFLDDGWRVLSRSEGLLLLHR
jgi:uncharacterized membrane protein